MKDKPKNPAAQAMGRIKSERKSEAARANGKKGGRPKKPKPDPGPIDMNGAEPHSA